MALESNDRRAPQPVGRLRDLLDKHIALDFGQSQFGWGPLGQVTLHGGRRVLGGDVRARLTKRRDVPMEVGVEYWKNGIHAEVTRTPDGRFGGSISKTYRF